MAHALLESLAFSQSLLPLVSLQLKNQMLLFSDGSDLEGVAKVQDLQYMRIARWFMQSIAAWPIQEGSKKESIYMFLKRCCIFMMLLASFLPELMYVKNMVGILSFFEMGHTYITLLINFVALTRILLTFTKNYKNIAEDFVNKIHLFNSKNDSEYSMKMNIFIHKLSHFFTVLSMFMLTFGLFLFNFMPLYNNYSSGMFSNHRPVNGSFEHTAYYTLPFDYTTNLKGYLCVFFSNLLISYNCASYIFTINYYLSLQVFHVWGHLQVLIHRLNNFPRPKQKFRIMNTHFVKEIQTEWYSDEENLEVTFNLTAIHKYHLFILSYISKINRTLGPLLLVFYGFIQASGCLLLLECSQLNSIALLRYGTLTFAVFQQLIQVSIIFELLGSMTDKLANATYGLPWECMNVRNRKTVFAMLRLAQKNLSLRPLNIIDIGCRTMVSILKNSMSYFIMLRTVATEDSI